MMLASMGVAEAEARDRPIEWIEAAAEAHDIERRARVAIDVQTHFMATAAAHHGGDALEAMQEMVDNFLNDVPGTDRAQPFEDALPGLVREGVVIPLRVKVSDA